MQRIVPQTEQSLNSAAEADTQPPATTPPHLHPIRESRSGTSISISKSLNVATISPPPKQQIIPHQLRHEDSSIRNYLAPVMYHRDLGSDLEPPGLLCRMQLQLL
ncbi:hypothetical protein K440DRAFT_376804 [Wilcoxina mikolae CBS 423.85]|nr:hypothetical protein K440DRAFT_376804 [Wilcoxina mikolae CBS 423.85]